MNKIPSPVTLTFKGQPVTLSPLTISDAGQLASYMRDKYMEEAIRQMKLIDDPDFKQFAYVQAKKHADNIQIGREEFDEAFKTPEVMVYFFFISLRKSMPNLTFKECEEYLSENPGDVMGKINEAAGMQSPLAEPGEAPQTA